MNKYNRYFKVTEGALIEAVKECRANNKKANKEYEALLKKIGAEENYYVRDHRLVAVTFKDAPDPKVFKRNTNTKDGWYPKKNCKAGKEIAQAIESIKVTNEDDCLEIVGLSSGPRMFFAGYCYRATLVVIPKDALEIYISVPWYDEDPAVLEQYKVDRAAGNEFDSCKDAILWEPTPEMTEVKEWEVKKAIQEWNDSLKAEAAA